MKAGKGVGQERRGGIGLGIHGVGIEFEREKGISRVEFHPHHHGGGAGKVRGCKIKRNPQTLPNVAREIAVYRRLNSACDAIEKGPTTKWSPADFSIETNSTQIRKSGIWDCWSMVWGLLRM